MSPHAVAPRRPGLRHPHEDSHGCQSGRKTGAKLASPHSAGQVGRQDHGPEEGRRREQKRGLSGRRSNLPETLNVLQKSLVKVPEVRPEEPLYLQLQQLFTIELRRLLFQDLGRPGAQV